MGELAVMSTSTSLSDWMSDADFNWRQRLAPVRLAIETNFFC